MSFPNHDANWTAVANYLDSQGGAETALLAPDLFWQRFPTVARYLNTHLDPTRDYDWIVAHKGELGNLNHRFLRRLQSDYRPAFANPVFVVLAREGLSAAGLQEDDPDVLSLWDSVERALAGPEVVPNDSFMSGQGELVSLATLSKREFREAMNAFWRDGGYTYPTLRDRIYCEEIDDYISKMVGTAEGLQVLDLCSGTGRLKPLFTGASAVVGIDVSDVAIDMARAAHADADRFTFQQMDAHKLSFPDGVFDLVMLVDAIEHVMHIEDVLAEAYRVMKPGGRLLVTGVNRNSVHAFMSRRLGFGDFLSNPRHIREFSFAETCEMHEALGLRILDSGGMLLYPYWGIPGVDDVVRELTDDDPETVMLFRDLGRKVGPEHAYSFVLLMEKTA